MDSEKPILGLPLRGIGPRTAAWWLLEGSGNRHKCYPLGNYVCPECGKTNKTQEDGK